MKTAVILVLLYFVVNAWYTIEWIQIEGRGDFTDTLRSLLYGVPLFCAVCIVVFFIPMLFPREEEYGSENSIPGIPIITLRTPNNDSSGL